MDEMAPPTKDREPWAMRHQPDYSLDDLRLTDRAHIAHPLVAWWWGWRADGTVSGAFCYLCEQYFSTWAHNWPMPKRAMGEIEQHRDSHLSAGHHQFGNRTAAQLSVVVAINGEHQS